MNIFEKMERISEVFQCEKDFGEYQEGQRIIAVLSRGNVSAIPINQCHLAKSDEDTLIITPYPDHAVLMHMFTKKPIWLYDRADDLEEMRVSARDLSAFVLIVARLEEAKVAEDIARKWSQVENLLRFAPCSVEDAISRFLKAQTVI